jgi:hypothetical protein
VTHRDLVFRKFVFRALVAKSYGNWGHKGHEVTRQESSPTLACWYTLGAASGHRIGPWNGRPPGEPASFRSPPTPVQRCQPFTRRPAGGAQGHAPGVEAAKRRSGTRATAATNLVREIGDQRYKLEALLRHSSIRSGLRFWHDEHPGEWLSWLSSVNDYGLCSGSA